MPLELFEIPEQFMIDTANIKLTQFEKTGLLEKVFIPLWNLQIKFHFRIDRQAWSPGMAEVKLPLKP